MSINKNAFIRYQTLDKCFRNTGRKFFINDLIKECDKALQEFNIDSEGISRRQIYYDIRFMESEQAWSVPLEKIKDGKKIYYRYSNPKFSINNQPINETEAEQIKSALLMLSRFKGMPQFEWVNEIIPKFEQAFELKQGAKEIISFDSNEYLKGIEFLGELFNAILYKKVLAIQYHSFKKNESFSHKIHPYYLKQYNNRWFLFGYNPAFNKLTNLSLDRILSIVELDEKYLETEIDFNEYFEDIIGVTRFGNSTPTLIELQFSTKLAPYILTKPLHGSQKKKSHNENGLTITIEVIPNYELERLILSFGESVKIISPYNLKENILKRINEAVNLYT
jgi:predicted DNA-binding transcriptional regulator YafY